VTARACYFSPGKDDGEEGYIDNHDDYGDGERSMRQGQIHNPYAMMPGAMGMPGNFYGQGGMGGIGGMSGGQMGAAGGMGMYRHGPPDHGSFRQQQGPPGGGRAGMPPVVPLSSQPAPIQRSLILHTAVCCVFVMSVICVVRSMVRL